ncbi:unnamed protein product (macronuclear) [Paramecium tetraurelia]|uniref:Uncharacterized protein n=1 Tax=Paramecium tetraurelia TaxID=5888 RepID=A0E6V9_PARTE|nr:uncharacterized protein GSPATT00023754001 [Paramecium tetraurelia]CAK91026.1 unnamed protein product [Paramecium tetraurelia]|eukprot:XP_001458423.1 hypothetical protein (macronuclear) [Paramecium tetraurelia strain d4-2]
MKNLKECLSSEGSYKNIKRFKENIQDEDTLNQVVETLEDIFQSPKSQPIQLVLAMRVSLLVCLAEQLTKELMDLHYDCVVYSVTNNIIYMIEDIIMADLKKNERGKFYFSDQPDQSLLLLGNTLIRLALESIFVWNLWHPNNLAITQVYQRLIDQGVQFPKLHYFNAQKVKEYYLTVKESSKNGTLYRKQSLMLNDQYFDQLKQKIEKNQYNTIKLHEINEELKQIKHVNENQKQFIENFNKAYKDYLVNNKLDEFNNQVQSICLEYDELSSQKKQNSAIQLCTYSTDKQSNQFSRSISSQNSQQKNGSNNKQQSIEQLLHENELIQAQIQSFEIPKVNSHIQNIDM